MQKKRYQLILVFVILSHTACGVADIEVPVADDDYQYYPDTASSGDEAYDSEVDDSSAAESSSTESDSSSTSYPETASSLSSNDDDTATEAAAPVVDGFDWNRVLITEVVTDPQQDHGETSVGNGVIFDATPGTGTIGSTDEYIEIFNGTDAAVDVSYWTLNMVDGTDVAESFSDSDWQTFFSAGGSLAVFQPGEFLVLGNPDGTINNAITIDLFDEAGAIEDELVVADANSAGLGDEAYYLTPDGDWEMGAATPGFFSD